MSATIFERGPRVILAGDSTVAPYVANAYPMCGWGAHLGAALNTQCARIQGAVAEGAPPLPLHVIDLAKNGASTESHREEGLWAGVLDATAAGDLVVLQFGHNDQKRPHLDPWGGFTAELTRMIAEIRELGAHPVLCTPVARRHYADGQLLHTHEEYPAAIIALAEQLGLPLLDLNTKTRDLIEALGEEPSRRLFTQLPAGKSVLYPEGVEDNTHFSHDGAIIVAQIVAELLAPIALETVGQKRSRA